METRLGGRRGGLVAVAVSAGTLGLGLLAGCGKEEPQYYEVKEVRTETPPAAPAQPQMPSAQAEQGDPHSQIFDYTLPEGWSAKQPGSMVLLAFQAGAAPEQVADLAVSAFPGDVGGKLANINRWRRQVGLGPVDAAAVDGFVRTLAVAGIDSWQVDFTGPAAAAADGAPVRMVVTAVPHGGQTWFFKMTGPAGAVEAQLANYGAFLGSVRF